ncbi:iron complex transport system ATP-binding protein [Devosia sp. YR412]|uniref:ABC transporter ATP-binding protein n=1 Tax=Devosia sp. YR412 TaxID=1881030 RepID=UPI0008C6EBA9|nr:ABC transporter ATP-binding protein [Devosia sp. YR412]SEQ61569.1 iron complex transport system ATP-binding protein [Devosia sp. YR412]
MPNAARIEFDRVAFGFGRLPILEGLSFTAEPGEFLAIVGPNGCGKSTTLKLMAGLLQPMSGAIRVGEQDIASLSRKALARQIALLTQQSFAPPNMSVYDLVAMGRFAHQNLLARRSREDEAQIAGALLAMQVQSLQQRRVGELSGGQLQRARMAMTLAQDSAVLLLDEPTTFLDLRYQYSILERAQEQARAGRTVVAVLHDFTQASLFADRVAVMHEGRMVQIGKPADVLTEDVIAEVFGVRTRAVLAHGAVFHVPESQAR